VSYARLPQKYHCTTLPRGHKIKKLDTVSPLQSKALKYFNIKQRPPNNQKGLSGLAHAVGENLEKVGEVVVSLSSPSSHYWQQIRGRVKKQHFFSALSQAKFT
jgi:hypothetical protein